MNTAQENQYSNVKSNEDVRNESCCELGVLWRLTSATKQSKFFQTNYNATLKVRIFIIELNENFNLIIYS